MTKDKVRSTEEALSTVRALKLALEALEEAWYHVGTFQPTEKAIDLYDEARTAIKEALAQPEQEPVAWRYKILDYFGRPVWTLKTPKTDIRVFESQPLYTTPPPVASPHKRPSYVPSARRSDIKPLSDEEIILIVAECASSHQHTDIHFARAIEAAIWEKNK